jgi:hypothetical protein
MGLREYKYCYFYVKNYNPEEEPFPNPNIEYDILLRYKLKDENKRVMSGLEGLFFHNKPLVNGKDSPVNSEGKIVIKRSDMKEFAKKYEGEFVLCMDGEE